MLTRFRVGFVFFHFFFFFLPMCKDAFGKSRQGPIDRKERGKQKMKGVGSLLAGTIKEVCATAMLLYLTKTEREERGEIIPVLGGEALFAKFVFLRSVRKWRECL